MKKIYDKYTGYQAMTSSNLEIHLYKNVDIQMVEKHAHDFFEIYCLLEGNVTLNIEGSRYPISKETIVLLPPGISHGAEVLSDEYERIVLWINPWYLNRISSRKTNLSSCFAMAKQNGYLLEVEPFMRNQLISYLLSLICETHEKEFGTDIMIDAMLQQLLIVIHRQQSLYIQKEKETLKEIIKYINKHYTETITLDYLCQRFFISKFYLSRSFRVLTGKSVYQYILEKRMSMAKQLLIYGEKPTSIYINCGFSQYSNFYRAFKKYYKISPNDFLKNINSIGLEKK